MKTTTIRLTPKELDALWMLMLEGMGSFEGTDSATASELRAMRRVMKKIPVR